MFKSLILFAALLAIVAATQAQAPPRSPTVFSGTVVSFIDDSVTLTNSEGKTVVVQMTPGWTVSIARVAEAGAMEG